MYVKELWVEGERICLMRKEGRFLVELEKRDGRDGRVRNRKSGMRGQ